MKDFHDAPGGMPVEALAEALSDPKERLVFDAGKVLYPSDFVNVVVKVVTAFAPRAMTFAQIGGNKFFVEVYREDSVWFWGNVREATVVNLVGDPMLREGERVSVRVRNESDASCGFGMVIA